MQVPSRLLDRGLLHRLQVRRVVDVHLAPRVDGQQDLARVRVHVPLPVAHAQRVQDVGLVEVGERQQIVCRLDLGRIAVEDLHLAPLRRPLRPVLEFERVVRLARSKHLPSFF